MRFVDYLKKLQRMDMLIRRKSTGTPEEFAQKLCCSRAILYRYLSDLKDLDAPVIYNKVRKSFIYERDYKFPFLD